MNMIYIDTAFSLSMVWRNSVLDFFMFLIVHVLEDMCIVYNSFQIFIACDMNF